MTVVDAVTGKAPASISRRGRLLDLLANTAIFRGLAAGDLVRIAAGTRETRVERGQVLFRRGETVEGFHIVAVGQVKLSLVAPDGAERVVEILGPGKSFGEPMMFMEKPYMATATALGDGLVLHVSRETLFRELDRDPRIARRMLAGLALRVHGMVQDMEAVSLHSATQRVIGYLVRLEEGGSPGKATLPAQKALVASRLNLTPEYFSRILHDLAAASLIQVAGRDILILDPAGLQAYGVSQAGAGPSR